MTFLNYIAKLLAHLGLLATLVYVFIFQIHLNGWLDWVWFICMCLLSIYGFVGNCAVFNEDEESNPKVILSCVGLIDFIICGSILLKIFNNPIDDISFVALPITLFVFVAGINRLTMCMLFIAINILLIYSSIDVFNWHSIALLITTIILQVGMLINSFMDRCANEGVVSLNEVLGFIVISGTFGYLLYFNFVEYSATSHLLFLLVYLITSLSACIQNNLKLYAIMPSAIVIFSVSLVFEWHYIFSWIIIAIVCLYSLMMIICINGLFNQLKLIVQYTDILASANKEIINKHNELVNEHNRLIKTINSRIDDSDRDKPENKPGVMDTVGKGFFREAGKTLFKILTGM